MATRAQSYNGLPGNIMGVKPKSYTVQWLHNFLGYYGVPFTLRTTKPELLHLLAGLVEAQHLNRFDRGQFDLLRSGNVPIVPNFQDPRARPAYIVRHRDDVGAVPAQQGYGPPIPIANEVEPQPFQFHQLVSEPHSRQARDCAVCLEEKAAATFPRRRVVDACQHESNTCLACLQEHIAAFFQANDPQHIACPTCNERLEHKDVREFATDVSFQT